jgi:hypothetical protein
MVADMAVCYSNHCSVWLCFSEYARKTMFSIVSRQDVRKVEEEVHGASLMSFQKILSKFEDP